MTLSPDDLSQRQQLRRTLRARRRSLSPAAQRQASRRLRRHMRRELYLHQARHIGVYLANDGELDALPALSGLDRARRRLYLPVLPRHGGAVLHFVHWRPGEPLVRNRFGIGEPRLRCRRQVPLWRLDVLLLPLVAFDDGGARLGMGGGFYDRALATLARRPARPRLTGVAHGFQRVARLPTADWDQPVDNVITD